MAQRQSVHLSAAIWIHPLSMKAIYRLRTLRSSLSVSRAHSRPERRGTDVDCCKDRRLALSAARPPLQRQDGGQRCALFGYRGGYQGTAALTGPDRRSDAHNIMCVCMHMYMCMHEHLCNVSPVMACTSMCMCACHVISCAYIWIISGHVFTLGFPI